MLIRLFDTDQMSTCHLGSRTIIKSGDVNIKTLHSEAPIVKHLSIRALQGLHEVLP